MIPLDLNPAEVKWFDGLKKKYSPLDLEWWGKTKLQDLLANHPDIARDFQPPPNIVVILTKENVDSLDALATSAVLSRAIGSANLELPSDVVSGIIQDLKQRANLSILIWAPSPVAGDLYLKACTIRDSLTSIGHQVQMSEEVFTSEILANSGLNLSVAEVVQARSFDYIICLALDPHSLGIITDFARVPRLSRKMLICLDSEHRPAGDANAVLRLFEGNNGKLDWFENPFDLNECNLATRVLEHISKVAEARQWIVATAGTS